MYDMNEQEIMKRKEHYRIKRRSLIERTTMYSQIKCPNCERSFGKKAAQRHIPVCKKILAKPTRLIRKGKKGYSCDKRLNMTNQFPHNNNQSP